MPNADPRPAGAAAAGTCRTLLMGSTALLSAALLLAAPCLPARAQAVPAGAAPTGGRVVAGAAAIQQSPGLTQVVQSSNRAAVDWQQFNVGAGHQVNFQQPSAASWTLNRVTGPDPSVIAGRITANGGVALVNQSGMVFAQGSQVNVASLIASAPNITNENFMAGRMVFDQAPRPGARVENRGTITVAERGLAAMVGPGVANSGTIRAKLGRVALAGAEGVSLDLAGDGLISIDVTRSVRTAPDGATSLVTNSGVIQADGGSVLLTAHAASGLMESLVANAGRVEARTVPAGAEGPERPGSVALRAQGGGVQVAGTLAARGGAGARGGSVAVNADGAVAVAGTARLDASGGTGGGQVLVGTPGLGVQDGLAARTVVARGARLSASARQRGNGGTVAVSSREETVFQGAASARGGRQGGDGGTVEMSGHGAMTLDGTADVRAPAGGSGTVLLDPQDITVVASTGSTGNPVQSGNGTVLAASAPTNGNLNVSSSQIENFSGRVRLEATRNITVTNPVIKTNGGLQLVAQTGLVDVQQQVTATTETTIQGATVRIGANVSSSSGTVTVTSTSGAITVGSGATVAAAVSARLNAETDIQNGGSIIGGTVGTTGNAVQFIAGRDISNSGFVAGTGGSSSAAAIFFQAGGRVAGGSITNSGAIAAFQRSDGTGGRLYFDTVGVDSGYNNSVMINGGPITNTATGTLVADQGLTFTSNASILNSGQVSGGVVGTANNAINLRARGSITNDGLVTGTGGGLALADGGTASGVFIQAGSGIGQGGSGIPGAAILNTGQIVAHRLPDGTGGNLRLDTAGLNTNTNSNAPISGGPITNGPTGALAADHQVRLTANTSVENQGVIYGGLNGNAGENAVNLAANTSIDNSGTILGIGGGRLFNNNQNSVSAVIIQPGTDFRNSGAVTSTPEGDNYGAVSITAGRSVTNTGAISSARNTLVTADGYIDTSGTVEAQTGRVALTADGNNLPAGQTWSIRQAGGVIQTLNAPPPNPAPSGRGNVILQANSGDVQLLSGSRIDAAQDLSVTATSGMITLDGLGGTFSVRAGRNVSLQAGGAARVASADVAADTLVARAGNLGDAPIDLGLTSLRIGTGMLFSAGGGITNVDATPSTVAPLAADQARPPVVAFDTRRGTALTGIPSAGLPLDAATLTSASPATQAALLGAPTSSPAGDVAGLRLDAGSSPVFFLVNGGRISGALVASQVGVYGFGGSAALTGALSGRTGNDAAALASVTLPAAGTASGRYQFNACVFASANCTVADSTRPEAVVPINVPNVVGDIAAGVAQSRSARNAFLPQPEIVRFRGRRGRLADPDILLPNVVEEDY